MNNDLISREALKKSFIQWSCSGCAFRTSENPTEICCDDCYAKDIEKEVIDNAPTVDNPYQEGHIDGMLQAEKLYARPQGEWQEGPRRNDYDFGKPE